MEVISEYLSFLFGSYANRVHYRQKVSIATLWTEERSQLFDLPQYEYEVFRYDSFAINKTGFVMIDSNRYGVSPELAGQVVQAKLWFDKIELFHDHRHLKTFRRSYGKNQECLDWRDYLPTLVKKPAAVTETKFFNEMPKLWQRHLTVTQGAERKSALLLLSEIVNEGNDTLCDEALRLASQQGRADTESIRQCYYFISRPEFLFSGNIRSTMNSMASVKYACPAQHHGRHGIILPKQTGRKSDANFFNYWEESCKWAQEKSQQKSGWRNGRRSYRNAQPAD